MKAKYIEDFKVWEQEFKFSIPITVRFSETDMFGHLNNTVPFVYFEHARIAYLKEIGLMGDWMAQNGNNIPVVADLQCDYMKQVFFDEELNVYVKASSFGTSSVDIHYMGKNEKGDVVFTGRSAIVQIEKKTGKSIPWTDKEKSYFN